MLALLGQFASLLGFAVAAGLQPFLVLFLLVAEANGHPALLPHVLWTAAGIPALTITGLLLLAQLYGRRLRVNRPAQLLRLPAALTAAALAAAMYGPAVPPSEIPFLLALGAVSAGATHMLRDLVRGLVSIPGFPTVTGIVLSLVETFLALALVTAALTAPLSVPVILVVAVVLTVRVGLIAARRMARLVAGMHPYLRPLLPLLRSLSTRSVTAARHAGVAADWLSETLADPSGRLSTATGDPPPSEPLDGAWYDDLL